jgi:hypothetical protein
VPLVSPFAKATEIEAGGQVEKYPADDPEPATDAVMAVVPGMLAVITLVVLSMVAIDWLPTVKERVPMEEVQAGMEVTPGATFPVQA